MQNGYKEDPENNHEDKRGRKKIEEQAYGILEEAEWIGKTIQEIKRLAGDRKRYRGSSSTLTQNHHDHDLKDGPRRYLDQKFALIMIDRVGNRLTLKAISKPLDPADCRAFQAAFGRIKEFSTSELLFLDCSVDTRIWGFSTGYLLFSSGKKKIQRKRRTINETEPEDFKNFIRMDEQSFYHLSELIRPKIEKVDTKAIPATHQCYKK
ncbi:hypothetical protein FQA39_LY10179 [Lamprigera yunnana]|nr:hypothetical protein FQA39_LY10179 [Lamprigera yunnana]